MSTPTLAELDRFNDMQRRALTAEAKIARALNALATPGATNWERVQAAGLILNGAPAASREAPEATTPEEKR